MKKVRLIKVLIMSVFFTAIYSCSDDPTIEIPIDPTENEVIEKENQLLSQVVPSTTINTYITGRVLDENHQPLANVLIESSDFTTTTDEDGYFSFGKIVVNAKYALVKASKTNYLDGFRTFSPTTNAINTVTFQLLSKDSPVNLNAENGGNITVDNDILLKFPANSLLDGDGEIYNGQAKVYGRYMDPYDEDFGNIMPGILAGLTDESTINGLLSYGMLTVEIEDNEGNILAVDPNQNVEISLPAPSVNAPTNIPLWHFNETYGLWIEAGVATLVNDRYVGEVNHFSTWNLDVDFDAFEVSVTVKDNLANPIANLDVDVLSENGDILAQVYTDNNGQFNLINAPEVLTFEIELPCETISFPNENVSSGTTSLIVSPTSTNARTYSFSGTLTDCDIEGNTIIQSNKSFSLRSPTNASINLSGLTDVDGQYELSTILCDIPTGIEYPLEATVNIEPFIVKDTILDVSFNGNSQVLDIDYCGISTDSISDNFIILFEDENFEWAVRYEINKLSGNITYADVKNLETADFAENYIENISGIEYFTSLETLDISDNLIQDVSLLASLPNLVSLTYTDNGLQNLTSLSALVNLTKLDISNYSSQLYTDVDISPLSSLENLTSLNISNNKIISINPLESLTKLEKLDITNTTTDNITPLANLNSLTKLFASFNTIVDLSPLTNLTGLTSLKISYNEITDVTPISNLTSLSNLEMTENWITQASFSQLSNLVNLDTLIVGQTSIAVTENLNINDISIVANFTKLKRLSLFNMADLAVDISYLSGLNNLKHLTIYGFPVKNITVSNINDISPLANLTELTYLQIRQAGIDDISSLSNLTNLEILIFYQNNIEDISVIANFVNLNELNLRQNHIADASPLCGLGSSFDGEIDLRNNNQVDETDISILEACLPNATIEY